MHKYKLTESEYRFSTVIWDNEPVESGILVKLCSEKLGWKKSTTYTVLKKLCEKQIFQNEDCIITSLVKKEQIQKQESEDFVNKTFGGSLPKFITAFMNDKKLSNNEAEALKKLIDSYKEG